MSFEFTQEHIEQIAAILGVEAKHYGNHYRFEILGATAERRVSLEVYPRIPIGDSDGALISVFTPNSNLQIQHCAGVVVSELMGEVTFFAEGGGKLSGLIIEREGGCSMYANVDRELLSGDFTKLGPEVMLSGIALSLTEIMLPDEGNGDAQLPGA
ncbi:MAG: hypothetical protein M5R41_00915 [Bacteroidia bacterium]|nr:hypothetical protein [Bacteroidia bacterium]